MLRSGSPRIAYYYAEPDTSTFRYRVLNMIEVLALAAPGASAAWFTAADGDRARALIDEADVLVVCRVPYTPHVASIVARAKALGRRVLFDVDDLIFDTRYTHLIMDTLDQRVDEAGLTHWFAYISRVGATLRLCDGVLTTNEALAERVRAFHDVPTFVIPNFLNHAQLKVSNSMLEAKRSSGFARDGLIHLGYFSGTPSHNRDFAIVEPALVNLLERDTRVRLRVVGYLSVPERLLRYRGRVEVLPLDDFLNLQRLIGEVEINVIPLQENEFTNCKSELKYFEAAAVGTISVASPTRTLRSAIRHGENGFTAFSYQWEEVLTQAVDTLPDVARLAEAAATDALERFAPEAQHRALLTSLLV